MEVLPDIFRKVMLHLPFKDLVRLSTVDRASRRLLHSPYFIRERATMVAPEPPGFLRTMKTRVPGGRDLIHIPYNDAHGRLHRIRLDFLVPYNAAKDDVTVEASHGGYILYSTTPVDRRKLNYLNPEIDICICNPLTFYNTVLPRTNLRLLRGIKRFALMIVDGAAPNIRYRVAFVSFLNEFDMKVMAYDSASNRGWQQFESVLTPPNKPAFLPYITYRYLRPIRDIAGGNFQSLFFYKPRGDRYNIGGKSCILVLNLQVQLVWPFRCPKGFHCKDVFIHQNNRIIALGMVQRRRREIFSFRELLQRPGNLEWTAATLAEQSARLNNQLATEPAYSIDWRIFKARSVNSILFRRRNDFALYNIGEASWHPFNDSVPDRREMCLDFHPP